MKKFLTFSLLLFLSVLPFGCSAATSLDIVINEIAWMGTRVSSNDEWIELYNNSNSAINLDGWQLVSEDGTPEVNLTGTVPSYGFYLLERTDDNTVPGITADLIYKGALGNSGEDLKLYDSSNNLIDEINCSIKWLAGDNTTKQTMERTPTGWQTSENPGGTPRTKNSIGTIIKTEPAPVKEKEVETGETRSPQAENYPSGVVFNEILPSPEGADETEEWIEIYNQNDFEVDLSGWKIEDKEGKITSYVFPGETKISPNGYLVLKRPETKITLNNEKDSLNLINPKGEIISSITYEKSPRGQSYSKTESGWIWSTALTPGSTNTQKTEAGPLLADSFKEKGEAAAKSAIIDEKSIKSKRRGLMPLIVGSILAVFSGIAVLIIKKTTAKLS